MLIILDDQGVAIVGVAQANSDQEVEPFRDIDVSHSAPQRSDFSMKKPTRFRSTTSDVKGSSATNPHAILKLIIGNPEFECRYQRLLSNACSIN